MTRKLFCIVLGFALVISTAIAPAFASTAPNDSKDEFMAEKLEQAADVLNDEAAEIAMCPMKDGSLYAVREYDLGDDCKLVVELKDQSESAAVTPSIVPLATSGSNEMWKYPYVSAGYLDGIYALKESNSTGAFPD